MQHNRAILVVEDDDDLRASVCEILQDEGYAPIAVENGHQALVHLRGSQPPCLILLDLMMPVMNGWDFRAAQMQEPQFAHIPVIVMSATTSLHSQPLHATALLTKPLRVEKLLETVARHC